MTPEIREQIEKASYDLYQRNWDEFFLGMAKYVSLKSKDPSTKSGSVIVRPDRSVASIGFNGFPKKMPDPPYMYDNREEKYSRIIHSEVNAAIFCRDQSMEGYTLYNWPLPPCDRCLVEMVQHGITRFVAPKMSADAEARWGEAVKKTRQYIQECRLELLEVDLDE
jgi:dCMP deaminase